MKIGKKNKWKKWLAGTLAATLIISIAPADVFAAETREKQDQAKTAAIPVRRPGKRSSGGKSI